MRPFAVWLTAGVVLLVLIFGALAHLEPTGIAEKVSLDRYGLVVSGNGFGGALGYTDVSARLPAKLIIYEGMPHGIRGHWNNVHRAANELRGRVMAIGGLKEKSLAAHRAGCRVVIMPKDNEGDLEDIPEDVQKVLSFHPVSTLDEVFEIALLPATKPVNTPKTEMEEAEEEAAALAGAEGR